MKNLTAIILSLLCISLTACSDKNIQIEETTETLKVSVTSESETTIETITETSTESSTLETTETEIITETITDKTEEKEEELDFWLPKKPDDGYIITDPADSLTMKKLYPLICLARDYMMDSKDFWLEDENVYTEIENYAKQEEKNTAKYSHGIL